MGDVEKLESVFNTHDTQHSGLLDLHDLQATLLELNIVVDVTNASVLLLRYDEGKKGNLNFDEFKKLYVLVLELKHQFLASATTTTASSGDVSSGQRSVDVHVVLQIIHQFASRVTPKSVEAFLNIFVENHRTTFDFQEFLALLLYFQELEIQYDHYITGDHKDETYGWIKSLLLLRTEDETKSEEKEKEGEEGRENEEKEEEEEGVTEVLKKWTEQKKLPTFEEFDQLIVEHLDTYAFVKQFTRRKPVVRKIDVREKKKFKISPKRNITAPSPPDVKPAEVAAHTLNLSDTEPFVDPDFVVGPALLPVRAQSDVQSWKRPTEINKNAQLFINGSVNAGDVIQGALGNCWFLCALSVVATSADNFIEQLFTQTKPEIGYYQLRFFKNGDWRLVDIDDRLPCDASGQLYFASCRDPTEFWVPLVEKAYAKLHGSYDALEAGTTDDGLRDLTGEVVSSLQLDNQKFSKQHPQFWNEILHNLSESYVMGCSRDIPNVSQDSQLKNGLLLNHAYAIIDAQEVSGNKLLRIRNPWGRGEWNGNWADKSKKWTKDLLKHFNYDFANDGTFFMSYSDFISNFNRVATLLLLIDPVGEVWKKAVFTGEFKSANSTAGGCTNYPTWFNNPQYSITVDAPMRVFLEISQPDLRYNLKLNPSEQTQQYEAIGILVLKDAHDEYKKTSYTEDERLDSSDYVSTRDNSLEFTAQPGYHNIIIPSTFHPGVEFQYWFSVYTEKPGNVSEITTALTVQTIPATWQGVTAGGCQNNDTWLNNPQFLLEVVKTGTIFVTLSQVLATNQAAQEIGLYVFERQTADRETDPQDSEQLVVPKNYINSSSISQQFQAKDSLHYIIMPTTFEAGVQQDFTIGVSSPDTTIKTFTLSQ